MAMVTVTATASAWIEAPREASAAVVLQNQGYGDVFVYVGPTVPGTLQQAALIMPRLEKLNFSDFASTDKLWVRAISEPIPVLIWR